MAVPTTIERITSAAKESGFVVLGVDEFDHVRVVHPDTGRRVSIPTTVQHRRGIAETYRDILTCAGQPRPRASAATRAERHRRAITALMSPP